MMSNLLCFLVIFGCHLLLCCTKPVVEWHTSTAEHTGKSNSNGYQLSLSELSLGDTYIRNASPTETNRAGALLDLFN